MLNTRKVKGYPVTGVIKGEMIAEHHERDERSNCIHLQTEGVRGDGMRGD